MRAAFFQTLCELAEADPRIVLLTGDLGYGAVDPFRARFPDRFINVGVAEQNMIGMATGMAEAGLIPYAYSIATFLALRGFEFIRNGPVHHNLPVRLVGMGMGFEYGHDGPTHHALEDIVALRSLPGLSIVIPADCEQTRNAVRSTAGLPGPVYYSLSKNDQLSVAGLGGRFEMGRVQVVRPGRDIAIVTMGSVSAEALAAVEELAVQGTDAAIVIVSNFHPDPDAHLAEVLAEFPHAVTLEAQTISGGLASLVAGVIATHGLRCRLWPMAVTSSPDGSSGGQPALWRKHGLDRTSIVSTVQRAIGTVAR